MANIGKNVALTLRNKLFANINNSLTSIVKQVSALQDRQENILLNQNKISDQIAASSKKNYPAIIRVSDTEIITKIFSGVKVSMNPRDISVTPHLALDGIWEEDITLAWLRVIESNDVVFDIGANFGYYGLIAAQQTHVSGAKVIFFEANKKLVPYINKSLAINNYHEFSKVENLAVTEKNGTVKLTILKDYIGSSSIHTMDHLNSYVGSKIHLEQDEIVSVKSTSIDQYCNTNKIQSVNLIKMDIEGYEDQAYNGMRATVKSSPNVTMFIEFTKQSYKNPKNFYDLMLKDFGNLYTINPDGSLKKPTKNDYVSVMGDTDDWRMLVFSKKSKL